MANVQSIVFTITSFKVTLTAPADSSYHTGTGQVLDYNFPYTATYPFTPVFSDGVSIDPISADGSTVDVGKIFIPTGTTTFTFYVNLNFNDPYGPDISINGTIDSTAFSNVFSSATLQTTNAGSGATESVAIAYDYSSYFSRMITAQEQTTSATTESVTKLNQINSTLETLNSKIEDLNSKIEDLNLKIETIKTLAEGDGLHIVGPWEWLGQVGIVQYLEDKGLNLGELKAKVDAIPKTFTPPGGGS
jgi:hypothetical protein